MLMVTMIAAALGLAGVPDLTEAQRVQLATAEDGYLPDEPAWTGLLVNVASWEPAAVDGDSESGVFVPGVSVPGVSVPGVSVPGAFVPGAAVPDYGKLLAEPGAYRGDLFVVEGRFAGRSREMRTQRPGPWGGYLTEWGVVVTAEVAGTAQEVVALVYLVDPEGQIAAPREGKVVRGLTRFYKLWTDTDAEGVERTYPVFVGRSMGAVGGASGGKTGSGSVIFAGVVAMAGLLLVVLVAKSRAGSRENRREWALERLRRNAADHEDDQQDDPLVEQDLPDDPAEALEQLERRQDGREST